MPDYDRPHIDITRLLAARSFKAHSSGGGRTYARNREQHGAHLSAGLAASLEAADARRPAPEEYPENIELGESAFVTVTLHPDAKGIEIEKREKGIRQSAETVSGEELAERKVVLHIRDDEARGFLTERVERYRSGELSEKGNPPLAGEMQPIEGFSPTRLIDLWREDPATLPAMDGPATWWALWCWDDFVDDVVGVARALGMQVAPDDRWSAFPDVRIVPVHASRASVETLLNIGLPGLAELGHATDDPTIVVGLRGRDQDALAEDLAGRVTWPGDDVPAVCILDTGVNRAHPLIEPALSERDALAVDARWGADDHHRPAHGTAMGGLALHGDLTGPLADQSTAILQHRLESVKVLPPAPRSEDDPANYGAITQQAVAIAETTNPERERVICSAVTNDGRPGDRPTRWSAAIDSLASGADADENEEPPRRLFLQAIGNIPHNPDWASIADPTLHPGEDPAQAWNALSVGGVTLKDTIAARDQGEWSSCVGVGEHSPYGRTSTAWPDGTMPIKPEVVFEAGNRATNTAGDQVTDAMPSLSVISTGKGGAGDALIPFYATSAATAQASRMAARIMAEHPSYWPETVRALMVHSARWTPPMKAEIEAAPGMGGRKALRRRFGYGMPDLQRAIFSASNDLALVAQTHIQPYDRPARTKRDERPTGAIGYGQAHYYDLPWPTEILEQLENSPVQLRVTLSYFIEPYPLAGAMLEPARYRSFGLRFDLKRKQETEANFLGRKNAELGGRGGGENDAGWCFGSQAIAAGSLHSDTWSGTAVELASRNKIAIFPVMGWWRDRSSLKRYLDRARYALVITLEAPDAEVDLQAHVAVTADAMVATKTAINVEVDTTET